MTAILFQDIDTVFMYTSKSKKPKKFELDIMLNRYRDKNYLQAEN